MFWALADSLGASQWFELVTSAANISDEVSRDGFSGMHAMGALQLALDFKPVWPVFLQAVTNQERPKEVLT